MSMEGGDEAEIQQLSAQYEQLSEIVQELRAVVNSLESQIEGCKGAMEALDTLETDSEIMVPLGGGSYVQARVENVDEILVDVGADIRIGYDRDEAVDTLEDRVEELSDLKDETEEEMQQRNEQLEQILQKVQVAQQRGQR